MSNRVVGIVVSRSKKPDTPAPLPGFEAVNDLGISIRADQMRELREVCEDAVIQMRLMRANDSRLGRVATRLEKAIRAIPATS